MRKCISLPFNPGHIQATTTALFAASMTPIGPHPTNINHALVKRRWPGTTNIYI